MATLVLAPGTLSASNAVGEPPVAADNDYGCAVWTEGTPSRFPLYFLLARSQEQVRSRPTYSAPEGALVTLLVTRTQDEVR